MQTPLIIGGYEIRESIGVGTYGEVRYGRCVATDNHVAVKIVDLSRFRNEAAVIMKRETQILRHANHEHVIAILDVKENIKYRGTWCSACACTSYQPIIGSGGCQNCPAHDSTHHSAPDVRPVTFVVTELALGGELFGLLMHCGPFPEDIARLYFNQLLSGLEYCHSRGIIHRDLKPENLVLDEHFNLKIVDFGLAALIDDLLDADNTTTTNNQVLHSGIGSLPYTAPEVSYNKELYQGKGYKGTSADLWSCAVILYIMLTGTPPFRRPLPKTYSASLRRCKHFVSLLSGFYPQQVSPLAKDLMSHIFVMEPEKRFTMQQIKNHPWVKGSVPRVEEVAKLLTEKARRSWASQGKKEMADMLSRVRSTSASSPTLPPRTSVALSPALAPIEPASPVIEGKDKEGSPPKAMALISIPPAVASPAVSVRTPVTPSLLTIALSNRQPADSPATSSRTSPSSNPSSSLPTIVMNQKIATPSGTPSTAAMTAAKSIKGFGSSADSNGGLSWGNALPDSNTSPSVTNTIVPLSASSAVPIHDVIAGVASMTISNSNADADVSAALSPAKCPLPPHPSSSSFSRVVAGSPASLHNTSGSLFGVPMSSTPTRPIPASPNFTPPLPSYLRFRDTPSAPADSANSMVSGSPSGLLLPWNMARGSSRRQSLNRSHEQPSVADEEIGELNCDTDSGEDTETNAVDQDEAAAADLARLKHLERADRRRIKQSLSNTFLSTDLPSELSTRQADVVPGRNDRNDMMFQIEQGDVDADRKVDRKETIASLTHVNESYFGEQSGSPSHQIQTQQQPPPRHQVSSRRSPHIPPPPQLHQPHVQSLVLPRSNISEGSTSGKHSSDSFVRDDFGVRQFTRLALPSSTVSEAIVSITSALQSLQIAFRVDPALAKVFVNLNSAASSSTHAPMLCCVSVLPCDVPDNLDAVDALPHEHTGVVLDYRKMKGDFIAFHEFFMRSSQLISRM